MLSLAVVPASPAKAARKAAKRETARKAALIRGDTLGWLLARGALNKEQHAAGVLIRALWAAKDGAVRNFDPTRVRVDGSRPFADASTIGAVDADRRLRSLVTAAGIGLEATEVVIRVCGMGESLTRIAIDFEPDPAKKRNGACGSDTLAQVRRLIRTGLAGLANVANGRPARGARIHSDTVLAWLAADARPRPEDTRAGDRPDLPRLSRPAKEA